VGGKGDLEVHAEGQAAAVDALASSLRALSDAGLELTAARVEGHEQFAQRGVSAGVFVVQEHAATAHHFDLRLEVDGIMRSWAVPKGPSLDPAVKRLALEVPDHTPAHNDFEGRLDGGGVVVWDRGFYGRCESVGVDASVPLVGRSCPQASLTSRSWGARLVAWGLGWVMVPA